MRSWLVIVLAACGSSPAPMPVIGHTTPAPKPHVHASHLWSFDPESYFSDHDFLDASAFSRDLVVLANVPPGGTAGSVGVTALDVKTGTRLWHLAKLGWLLHPPHATEPLYFAPYEKLGEWTEGYTHVDRLDPKTGKVIATIPLDRRPGLDFQLRMVWSKQGILVILDGKLTAFDWTTGKPSWTAQVDDDAYLFPPAVVGGRIVMPNRTNRVISLADGKQLAALPGACCDVTASPDGHHIFVRAGVDATTELDDSLHVVQRLVGEIRAASNTYYALETSENAPVAVTKVFAYGKPDPIYTLTPHDREDFYGAIALTERYLYFFHRTDATFWQQDLVMNKLDEVDHIGSHFVISTDAVGSSGPTLGTQPRIELPYLFTEEWGVHGYLVGDE